MSDHRVGLMFWEVSITGVVPQNKDCMAVVKVVERRLREEAAKITAELAQNQTFQLVYPGAEFKVEIEQY